MINAVLCGLLATALTYPVLAQTDLPQDVTDGFYITLEEVRANSRELFSTFAGPDGGSVSQQEFVSTELPTDVVPGENNRELLQDLFGVLDADGDGQLTRSEWEDRIERDLSFADENNDGRITLKELANARENLDIGDALGMLF
jgi:Ca2+-binding EF-hand superfamily protein